MGGIRLGLLLCVIWTAGVTLLAGCLGRSPEPTKPRMFTRRERIDLTLQNVSRYLVRCQAADGAWRSEMYGAFKDGGSLTPLALDVLLSTYADEQGEAAARKAADYLAGVVRPDGTIDPGPPGLTYPVYTSACAVIVLSRPELEHHRPARDAWLAYLKARQLTEELGWQPADKEYGGWGFSPHLPRKPNPGDPLPPLTKSNLSATLFAVEALRAAGARPDDPALQKALVFVKRCQNYADDPGERDPAFDDGGFFFSCDDQEHNKAGVAGTDKAGRLRFHSYGSATADGLRALLACGLSPDDERVQAARCWLEQHFQVDAHPGTYAPEREPNRDAVYYYYCWSAAQAFRACGIKEVQTSQGHVRWAEALADELLRRPRDDGTWQNPLTFVREDDPLLATCLAASTLLLCRSSLTSP
jgi:squalene-hopene/tetraprenyl-beta-curcumene cyclase